MSRTKKMRLGLSAAALALGAGIGVAGMASATTTPTPASNAGSSAPADGSAAQGGMGKHGGRGGERGGVQASALAKKLGVDEAQVSDALQAFREANKPSAPPAEGTAPSEGNRPDAATRDAALAASLAESLGLEESKVTAALEELRTERQAERAAGLKTRLDQAVTDGKLTQAEADAVTKAVEIGVIGGGGR